MRPYRLTAHIHTYMYTCTHTHAHTSWYTLVKVTRINIIIHTYIHIFRLHTNIHTYMHTSNYVHTLRLHTWHTYVHTLIIHTCTHIVMCTSIPSHSTPSLSLSLSSLSQESIVKLLLDFGANIDAQSVNGGTPLMRAIETSQMGIIKLLLGRG